MNNNNQQTINKFNIHNFVSSSSLGFILCSHILRIVIFFCISHIFPRFCVLASLQLSHSCLRWDYGGGDEQDAVFVRMTWVGWYFVDMNVFWGVWNDNKNCADIRVNVVVEDICKIRDAHSSSTLFHYFISRKFSTEIDFFYALLLLLFFYCLTHRDPLQISISLLSVAWQRIQRRFCCCRWWL